MMVDIYLLDENRNKLHIIDNYNSLIWASRYNSLGDCELTMNASDKVIAMFQESKYIARDDDDMVCRIEKIQITTDSETGDQLIVTGYDIKKILAQRIIWKQTNFNGFVEDYLRKLVTDNIINPSISARKINDFILAEKENFTEKITQQVTYDNLKSKIEETIAEYDWGYKVYINDSKQFVFKLYKGEDKTHSVVFSENYENLSSSEYTEDKTDINNVALVAGEGEGTDRFTATTGTNTGIARYELYVDARDMSKTIDYGDLITQYPNGIEVEIDGVTYYQVDGVNIAILQISSSNITAKLTDDVYSDNLISKGMEGLAEHKIAKSFNATVEPEMTFIYKKDYNLGDVVAIENEYKISIDARIIEVVEVYDDNGHSVEPKFEYLQDTLQ